MTTAMLAYRDPALPIDARVADLLGRMTRAEKVAQLGVVLGVRGRRRGRPRRATGWRRWPPTASARSPAWRAPRTCRPLEVAETANAIQRHLVEETRLGIPAIIHEECLHGLHRLGARRASSSRSARPPRSTRTSVAAVAATIRRRMLADRRPACAGPGLRHRPRPALGPDRGDLRRGPVPRGRARLRVRRGAPGPGPRATACSRPAKHLVGHGLAEGGRNQAPAHLGPRELRDEQLFPFEAAVRRRGIGERDARLLRRGRRALPRLDRAAHRRSCAASGGSTGIVASDYMGVEMLATAHRLTADLGEAARLALVAGVDAELPRTVGLRRAARRAPSTPGASASAFSTRPSAGCSA